MSGAHRALASGRAEHHEPGRWRAAASKGKDYKRTASINGIYRLDDLEKGDYVVGYDKGEIKVHLAHDELVDILEKNTQRPPILPIWAIYLIIAIVAVIGILAALKLAWMRK
jgi:hypothetical protein